MVKMAASTVEMAAYFLSGDETGPETGNRWVT